MVLANSIFYLFKGGGYKSRQWPCRPEEPPKADSKASAASKETGLLLRNSLGGPPTL